MCLKAQRTSGTGTSLMLNLFTSRDRMLCSYKYTSLSQGSILRQRLTLLMMARIPMFVILVLLSVILVYLLLSP
jgi:hypothetical protein